MTFFLEKLQRSGVQLSERLAFLGNHMNAIEEPPDIPRKSQDYGIEGLKEGHQLGPHYIKK